jgi:hypothetical protein
MVINCTCNVCGHIWIVKTTKEPKLCPGCHSTKWNDIEMKLSAMVAKKSVLDYRLNNLVKFWEDYKNKNGKQD